MTNEKKKLKRKRNVSSNQSNIYEKEQNKKERQSSDQYELDKKKRKIIEKLRASVNNENKNRSRTKLIDIIDVIKMEDKKNSSLPNIKNYNLGLNCLLRTKFFLKKKYIDLRKHCYKDSQLIPTKKGVMLNNFQWNALVKFILENYKKQ